MRLLWLRSSRQVHGEAFEITERAVSQGVLVRSTQDDAGCLLGLECFLPTGCAKAPTVARFHPWEGAAASKDHCLAI